MQEKCFTVSATKSLLLLLLLSSSVYIADCGRWCGTIRFALGHSLGYSIATAPEILVYTINTSAQVHINTRTGDVYCECLDLQETDVTLLQELEISLPIVSNHDRDQNVTVNFTHPCLIASCQHGMPLQPSAFTAAVRLQTPPCAHHLSAVHKQKEGLTIETRAQSHLPLSTCRTEDYAKLLVSSVIHPRSQVGLVKERDPVLVLVETFSLHLVSCAAARDHLQPLSLQPLGPSSPLSNPLLFRLPRQSGVLEFDSLHYTAEVMENSPLGTFVTTVQASDPDQDQLTYSMTSNDISNQDLFSIDPQSGVVTTAGSLDRETAEQYVFTVTAEDNGEEATSAFYTFKILDENDNSPTFQSCTFHAIAVPEDQQVGSTLLDLRVVDEDAGSNGLVSYQLLNNTGELFGVVASGPSGQLALLKLMRGLDHEMLTYFLLTLVAMDGSSPAYTSSATIEITVLDIADNLPQFNATSYSAVVPEEMSVGLYILTVHATTPDSPKVASISYYIVGGDPSVRFRLDSTTGELTLFQSLDFEATELYALTVQAQSGSRASLRTPVTVMLRVANVNDHEPTYSRTQYTISISESAAVGQHVIGVSAEDLDSGEFGQVTYQIVSSDASVVETFDLDSSSGSIRTRHVLDREQQDMYEFSVVAKDGGEPPLTGSVLVVVRVEDVNDQPPVFTAMGYEASVPENATSGTVVVTVQATDNDSDTMFLEYFLQAGNVQGRFSLDRTQGCLSTRGTLDREETAFYNLTVVASDGQLESSVQVIITITDVNDCYPIFPTNFYVVPALSESLPTGEEVLLLEAVDRDAGSNGQVSYSSSDLPSEFLLNRSSGAITLRQALDYESKRYHSFNVVASDLGKPSLSSTAHVEITVQDENDNRPEFSFSPQFGSVPENSAPHTSVLQLMASDADSGSNAILSYSIIADTIAMQAFSIDGSGVIHTQRELDREVRELYQLTVEVRDQGREPLATTTNLEVMILDEIDYSPVFSQVTYDVHLNELTPSDTVVVNVSAITLDAGDSDILYIITGGQNRSLFRIDQSTGAISTARTLDPQLQSGVYRLTVTALHHDLSESVSVFITLAVEDGTPRLGPLSLYLNTFASLLPDNPWRLGAVQVLQRRAELQYTFSLQPSPPRIHRYFTIDPVLGEISAASGTPSGYYALNVSVSASTATGFGLVEVYVHVLTNATLESAVVAAFGDSSEIGFASIQLERFAQFLSDIIPCTRRQVEIFGIQARPTEPSIVEVAFAIRTPDLQNYLFPEIIFNGLLANQSSARPTLLEFIPDACVRDPCPNLLQCQPVVQLHRHTPQVPSKVLKATGLLYLSHAFAQAFTCTCPQGYSLEGLCGSEINECASNPCHFGAACEDLIGDYRCSCPEQTLGKNCSVVCPSHSCQPCDSSPCLHDSSCRETAESSYSCDSCPWEEEYQGPNCELTSLHFTPGGFAAYPPLGSTARINVSFSFATVTPTGVLLYNGRVGGSHDYIAAELVIGQLQVGVSLGGGTVILKTESSTQLNDGRWHRVLIQLDPQGLTVLVGGCSSEPQYIQGAVESCLLSAPLPDTGARTLDVNGPLYIGGVEAYHMPLPLAISTFAGCLSHLALDGTLVDLATPTSSYGVEEGCPPLGTKCSLGGCDRGKCVPVWNGTLCSCEGDIPLCQISGSSVQLSDGFLQLQEEGSTTTIEHFSMALRTRRTSAVLAQFGSSAALEVRHGSLVYRRSQTDGNTALTLTADAFVSDGLWHRVELRAETFSTKLSVDDERVSCSRPEGGRVSVNSIVLGAQDPSSANNRLSGCLGSLILNVQPLDLARALSDGSLSQYSVSSANASVGCGNGDPCVGVACPTHSTCEPGWQEYSCACDSGFLLKGGSCVDPCASKPCMNGGTCFSVPLVTGAVFHCQCQPPYRGPTCEEVDNSCPEGFGPIPTCQRCLCAPEGVEDGVCDRTGRCLCRDLLLFSPSGDLGCQSCDCHASSSTSPNCDAISGQCDCVPNVEGRRCDRCAEGYAGLDEQGCKRAQMVTGSFSLAGVAYTNTLVASGSPLALRLGAALEEALARFGLPGLQEAAITAVSNSSGFARMQYQVSAYLPRDPSPLPLPSTHTLAAVMQSLVQSGWLGSYQTVPDSHLLLMSCDADPCDPRAQCHLDSTLPFICGACPGGTLDGLICRAELPQGCSGVDTDGDALPDTCDNCPHVFNPGQDKEMCAPLEGVCPAGVASNVLWSPTSAGSIDMKPCAPPLTGSAVRHCEEGGTWGEVNTAGCVSVLGQQLLAEVSAITGGRLPTEEQLLFSLAQLEAFSSDRALSAEDVRIAAVLLVELVGVWVVLVEGGVASSALEDLASTASNLLDPQLHPQWVGGATVGGAAEDFLRVMEQLASTASTELPSPLTVEQEHLRIETAALEDPGELVFTFSALSGPSSKVDFPLLNSSLPRPLLAVTFLPTIGQLLPWRYNFTTPTGVNLTVAGPVISVQVGEADHTSLVTPINLTLGHDQELVSYEDGDAVCVFWEYGESGSWSQEGCWVVDLNATHTVCQCSHLTAFAVLLPEDAFQVSGCVFPECYSPAVFTYIVLGVTSVPLLATWLVLACISSIQGLQTTVHKHQVAALTLTGLVFMVGIGRTEVEGVCAVLAIALNFLLLACLCWLLAGGVLVARILFSPQPKTKFANYLYIIGWAMPLLLCGIPLGVVGIISDSFVMDLGHPYYCWFAPEVAWVFAGPALLLVVVVVVSLVVVGWLLGRPRTGGNPSTSRVGVIIGRGRAKVSLCALGVLLGLFVFTWVFGLLAVYGQPFRSPLPQLFESVFAILYATMGGFVFIIFCLNSKVREACWSKLHHKDENSSLQATLASSSIQDQFNYQSSHHGRSRGDHMAFHNTLSIFPGVSPPASSFTPNSTLTHTTIAEDDLAKSLSLRTGPLPPSPSPTPPPLPPPLTYDLSTTLKSTTSQQQPWFIIPEATPLSPLTYGSDADISSEFSERASPAGDGDDVSATISELYRQARGQESPESYLECQGKQSSPQGTEDPLWYRQRDSISQMEVVPMPYETAVKPPSSPQRSVRWRDLQETDGQPDSSARRPGEHSPCSSKARSSTHNSQRVPEQPHTVTGPSPEGPCSGTELSNEHPERMFGPPSGQPHRMTGNGHMNLPRSDLQRPHPLVTPHHSRAPGMSRTVSDNLPRLPPSHPQIHRRTSEAAQHFPSLQVSQTSFASHLPLMLQSHTGATGPLSVREISGSRTNVAERTGDSYHSNGPSVEGHLNQVIRHADGSETHESLV